MPPPPSLIVHADWSVSASKRWMALGVLTANGRYHLHAPTPIEQSLDWLRRLRQMAGVRALLVGVDFPIGLPLAYARQIGSPSFLALLPQLGQGAWQMFYQVAQTPAQISLQRPFYPQRPGQSRLQHLLAGLNLSHADQLRRQCDLRQNGRRAAAPLFWTMGAQQVGKAAIHGWQTVLTSALQMPELRAAIWPFSGTMHELLQDGRLVLAEAYPGEFYRQLGLQFPRGAGGKRAQAGRQHNATRLLACAAHHQITLDAALEKAIATGFGAAPDGEDRFDATVGALGLIQGVMAQRPFPEPANPDIRRIEGWIWGQTG